jgi:hypothetical protein
MFHGMTTRMRLVLAGLALLITTSALALSASAMSGSDSLGYGRCCKCYCRHFEGSYSTCANSGCGHSYYDHY